MTQEQRPPSVPDFGDIPELPGHALPVLGRLHASGTHAARVHPTRSQSRRGRSIAMAASLAWFCLQFAAFGLRSDIESIPLWYLALLVGAPAATGLLATVVALRPGKFGLGARKSLLVALSLAFPAAFVLVGALTPHPYADGVSGSVSDAAYCLNSTLAWTVLPLVCAGLALRRAFAARALWRSGLLGAGAGLLAAGLYNLHCPIVGHWHLALAHGGAVVAATLAGALLLSRVTRL